MARMKQGVFSWEDVIAQRYQSNKPAPLRRHQSTTTTPGSPAPQPQCRLLSLSPELRLMIWESVLGGHRLHIIQRNPRGLGYIICPLGTRQPQKRARAGEPFCEICQGGGIPQPVKEADLAQDRRGSASGGIGAKLLSLALTCRQISLESTHLLYTQNTFEFSNPWTLPYFRPTIPLESWERIRSVELRWAFPGHWLPSKDPVRAVYVSAGRAQWLETCRALNRLPALRSFVLVLGSSWFSEPVEKLPVFLEPLRGLNVKGEQGPGYTKLNLVPLPVKSGLEIGTSSSSVMFGSGGGGSRKTTSTSTSTTSIQPSSSCVCTWSVSLDSDRTASEVSIPLAMSVPTWELRLQGQPYYLHELSRVGDDLRRRGIDCAISIV